MKVLVAGASGFVGRRLCPALAGAGHDVVAMTRNPAGYTGAGQPAHGDVHDPPSLGVNLLDNAVRHNTMGGTVQLSTGQQDGRAVISVANTGPLVPPDEIARLFLPFERLATTRAANDSGHGLGLSIVAAIANAHNATIAAHARPEGGLRIEVSFPGQPPDTTGAAEPYQLQQA